MGYRNYLYIADKKKCNKIRKMSKKELLELTNTVLEDEFDYLSDHDVLDKMGAEEAFELGKYIDFYDEIKPHLLKMFTDKEVHEEFNTETECMLAKPEILQTIATIYRKKVLKFYQDLMQEKSSEKYDTRTQLERMKAEVRAHILWNKYLDQLPNNKWNINQGWLYEYEIFDILHLMRVFNPKKQVLIWLGY